MVYEHAPGAESPKAPLPEPKMTELQDCIPCDFTEQENIERTVCCEVGRMECINPPKGKNFGFVSSLLVPAVFMLS